MNISTQGRVLSERDFNQLVFIAVPAFGYELRSFIQDRIWVGPQNGQFFFAKHSWRGISPQLYGLALQTMDHSMTGI